MKIKSIIFKIIIVSIFLFSNSYAQVVYQSQNITLLSNWTNPSIPAEPSHGLKYGGIWGWHDSQGKEYAIQGASDGTYFVDVTNPSNPIQVDFVQGRRTNCLYHEIKTYSHYAYLSSDDYSPNSFQIVDLQYLPDSVHVVMDSTLVFERAHTMWVDGDKLYAASANGGYAVNTQMAVYSLANPESPTLLRMIEDDYPTLLGSPAHDMLVRNDTIYASIGYYGLYIFHFNSTLNHFEYINSLTSYPSAGYNHSSALTADGHTLIFCDEVPSGLPIKALDVTNLQSLVVKSTFSSSAGATPHNPFMVGNNCFIAYYQEGLQVYDVSNPVNPILIGYFDTHNQSPLGGPFTPDPYAGAWGAYPFLPSGNVLVSDMQNGLFVLSTSAISGLSHPQKNNETVNIYPNPSNANEIITIALNNISIGDLLIELIDVEGRLISSFNTKSSEQINLMIPKLEEGVYLIKIKTDCDLLIKKLVINH